MSENTEPSSNSMKFAPMPMAALMAQLNLQLKRDSPSPDLSCTSEDDSDSSFGQTVSQKLPPSDNRAHELSTPLPKVSPPAGVKAFASEKKLARSNHNKENADSIWASNHTHPNKDSVSVESTQKNTPSIHISSVVKKPTVLMPHYNNTTTPNIYTSPVVKKRSVLMPHNNNPRHKHISNIDSAQKKTPEIKPLSSGNKLKTGTPKIKSGIRRFTPGSGRHSNKKTPIQNPIQNRDKVRCELFTQKQKDESSRQESQQKLAPVPETPLNRKPMPASYIATPSYPQGVVGGNNKVLFKTTSIKDKKYMYIKKLGTGGSSEVYKVIEVGTSAEFAVKCVHLATDHELAQGYINEVRLLRELQNSDRVIRLYDYEYDRTNQFLRLVLEAGETDLSSFLRARGSGLPPALVLHYWEEMLHAVHYIHEHGVIHADLKPANFLLVSGRLKLIDFGIASRVSGDATSVVRSQATGTYSYISPEALMGGAGGYGAGHGEAPIKISFRSDVWSLGCILYSMVYGRTPFGHIPNLAKLAAILDPNYRIEYPPVEHLPPSLISALKWCLTYNARQRPTVHELLSIPYLQPQLARPPLPQQLMEKLRLQATLTTQDYNILVQRLS